MSVQIGYAIIALVGFIALALFPRHLWPHRSAAILYVLIIWLVVGSVLLIIIFSIEPTHPFVLAVTNLSIYLFCSEVYIFVYALLAVGSLSIRILVAMVRFEHLADPFQVAITQCSSHAFLKERLDRLLTYGLLVEENRQLRITKRGKCLARAGQLLKQILAVGPGG